MMYTYSGRSDLESGLRDIRIRDFDGFQGRATRPARLALQAVYDLTLRYHGPLAATCFHDLQNLAPFFIREELLICFPSIRLPKEMSSTKSSGAPRGEPLTCSQGLQAKSTPSIGAGRETTGPGVIPSAKRDDTSLSWCLSSSFVFSIPRRDGIAVVYLLEVLGDGRPHLPLVINRGVSPTAAS